MGGLARSYVAADALWWSVLENDGKVLECNARQSAGGSNQQDRKTPLAILGLAASALVTRLNKYSDTVRNQMC